MKRTCSIAVALSISLFIYMFYRSEKTVVNELVILFLSYDTYAAIRSTIINIAPLNDLIVFSLPGGLWIFCATVLSREFYLKAGNFKIQVVLVPLALAIGLEFLQLVHLTNGRFDVLDIVFYLMFWLLACYLFPSHRAKQNIWSPFTLHGFICLSCLLSVYLAHVSQ